MCPRESRALQVALDSVVHAREGEFLSVDTGFGSREFNNMVIRRE
jgi:hypothetical protein